MFVGHLGVGLGLKKVEPEVNLGLLFFATLLLDFLLGIFVLMGIEQVHVPADYASLHYLMFTFPYSHGLLASLIWAALAFALTRWLWPKGKANGMRAGIVVGAAVFSHWICDLIEHVPELPLLGENSPKLGLSLWNHLGVALGLEILLTVGGLILYFQASHGVSRPKRYGVLALAVLLALFTMTQLVATTPLSATGAAVGWVVQPLIIGGIAFWLDQRDHRFRSRTGQVGPTSS